ncbi:hypothetical protein FHL15_003076 [Xylaria flabelliformis]|uniref:Uncharacterized protein n=1 Tax=Xylaria flabelliformis TaxID=2512241 RepID=A0A553I6Z1_9PEZI|nr:hypothetical protein FHL15_003076 [Xylaria flabelliformis]
MTAQFENSTTPSPESPTTYSITYVEAIPSQDGKLLQSQKPASIPSRQPLIETPTKSFTDSGYTSLSTTPSDKSLAIDRSKCLTRGPIIPLLFSKKKKVFFSDKPTDQPTRDRFRAIQPSFEKLLLEEIRGHQKPGTRYRPISIRLAMVGMSENDAQPHIAIFCQPEQKRLIQAFVKKDIVVDIYRPKDLGAPAFEVVVFGNAPRLRFSSNIEVVTDARYLPATPRETLCGIPISYQNPNGQRRNATFGGLIKVVTAKGSIELFGMTAGHLVHQWDHDSDEDMLDGISSRNAPPASPSAFEDDDGSFVDGITDINETNEDELNEYELDFVSFSEFPGALIEDRTGIWDFQNLTVLGGLIDTSKEDTICTNGQCYDWAIFQPVPYRMNLVPANPKAELRICDKRPGAIENRPVIVLSSTGCKAGTVSSEPGRLLLGGEEFIDAIMVTLSEGQGILDGNSGSWVVDATQFEVYGQLVASDVFGSGYVIPMTDILSDIKLRLGAQSVELPSLVDILQASTIDMDGRLATNGQDQYGLQTMSARISSGSPTPTLDDHSEIAILNSSSTSYWDLNSGYCSLATSCDTDT